MFIRCEFCHRWVLRFLYRRHWRKHARRRPDGQQEEHITLPPERRSTGSLEGVPRWYRHEVCGQVTGMPVDIIRSYLVDPFLYNDTTFCHGCHDYVHQSELQWTETGEQLLAYFDRLKREHVRKHGRRRSE